MRSCPKMRLKGGIEGFSVPDQCGEKISLQKQRESESESQMSHAEPSPAELRRAVQSRSIEPSRGSSSSIHFHLVFLPRDIYCADQKKASFPINGMRSTGRPRIPPCQKKGKFSLLSIQHRPLAKQAILAPFPNLMDLGKLLVRC